MTYRILSLDGGGSWALIEIRALLEIYGDRRGREILSEFDLVAANSGGSIVLACLIEDMTLSQALAFFNNEQQRRSVFSPTGNFLDHVLHGTGLVPKYSAAKKLPALRAVLPDTGDVRIRDVAAAKHIRSSHSGELVHFLLTSFDYDRNRAAFLRSGKVQRREWGTGAAADVTVAEAVHASTNAPVRYFDAPAEFAVTDRRYWDGAVSGCNNPVLAALSEAVGLGADPLQIVALSIGTGLVLRPLQNGGDQPSPLLQQKCKIDLEAGILKIAEAILDDPPDAASFTAHLMTGSGLGLAAKLPDGRPVDSRIVRMNPLISPVRENDEWIAPGSPPMDLDDFQFIANLDLDAITKEQVDAINNYTDFWLDDTAPNQPVRLDGDTLSPEIGQGRFSEARDAWNALRAPA